MYEVVGIPLSTRLTGSLFLFSPILWQGVWETQIRYQKWPILYKHHLDGCSDCSNAFIIVMKTLIYTPSESPGGE